MGNPYAAARAPIPEPPPRRALFSGFVAAAICLLSWFGTVSFVGGNSYRFSKAGFFAAPPRTDEIARLQYMLDNAQSLLMSASALCIVLGLPRLRAGKLRWARTVSIWIAAAGSYALAEFVVKALRPLIAGMP